MSALNVINAYAGIGGNRHLWPEDWTVTAIELDERVAVEYARRYPEDTVLVQDAHEFVMEHSEEFDAVWTSPPCPTHSRLAKSVAAKAGKETPPADPRLWQEIAQLQSLSVSYVVENVHVYYAPPIPPDVVTERHWYWTSSPPLWLTPLHQGPGIEFGTATSLAKAYGLPPLPRGSVSDPRKALRNAVVPLEGLQIALAAFEPQ